MADGILRDVTVGPARLILGDALAVMPGLDPVDHIVTDPPYEASMHAAKAQARHRKHLRTDGGAEPKALDFAPIDAIRSDVARLSAGLAGGWFIAFCTPEGVGRWADAINASAMRYKRACAWVKPDALPQMNGQGPGMGYEAFVAAWAGAGHARWNGGGKRGVYTALTNGPGRTGGHPTEKPWLLMRDILHDFTTPGDMVCDPFMGSGTTLVAALRTGRRSIGIELDPGYFDLAVARVRAAWEAVKVGGSQVAPEVQEALL
jgi:site-specific DNA-methyltransferase (adenine-specific)